MTTLIEGIYNKYKAGQPLTDSELLIGYNHFTALSKLLDDSGPIFALVAQEAHRVVRDFKGFYYHRT